MIARAAEIQEKEDHNVRDGHGSVFTRVLAGRREESKIEMLAVHRLPPGASFGPKRHRKHEEFFYILSGQAVVLDNGERISIGPGDLVVAPANRLIAIRNPGDTDLVFLAGLVEAGKPKFNFRTFVR